MIVGSGIDLCEVKRIEAAIARFGDRFIRRIFTEREIAYVERRKSGKYQRFAARFAAKEAAMKAIGTGWRRGVRWVDFEVANEPSGKPTLLFHGRGKEFADQLGVRNVSLSLTHTAEQGMAFLVLEN